MPSRKRNKGKGRRAAALASRAPNQVAAPASIAAPLGPREWDWEWWATWPGDATTCDHFLPLPAPDHIVSQFMKTWGRLFLDEYKKKEPHPFSTMKQIMERHPEVMCCNALRKVAADLFTRMGINSVLMGPREFPYYKNKYSTLQPGKVLETIGTVYAITILMLEDDDCFCTNDVMGKVSDLMHGERELVRFFAKRASCSCLKAKYAQVKEMQPSRTGRCFHCRAIKDRRELMVCSRCKVMTYCSKECQRLSWPTHQEDCNKHYKAHVCEETEALAYR